MFNHRRTKVRKDKVVVVVVEGVEQEYTLVQGQDKSSCNDASRLEGVVELVELGLLVVLGVLEVPAYLDHLVVLGVLQVLPVLVHLVHREDPLVLGFLVVLELVVVVAVEVEVEVVGVEEVHMEQVVLLGW